jgi:hypothetical protein
MRKRYLRDYENGNLPRRRFCLSDTVLLDDVIHVLVAPTG